MPCLLRGRTYLRCELFMPYCVKCGHATLQNFPSFFHLPAVCVFFDFYFCVIIFVRASSRTFGQREISHCGFPRKNRRSWTREKRSPIFFFLINSSIPAIPCFFFYLEIQPQVDAEYQKGKIAGLAERWRTLIHFACEGIDWVRKWWNASYFPSPGERYMGRETNDTNLKRQWIFVHFLHILGNRDSQECGTLNLQKMIREYFAYLRSKNIVEHSYIYIHKNPHST